MEKTYRWPLCIVMIYTLSQAFAVEIPSIDPKAKQKIDDTIAIITLPVSFDPTPELGNNASGNNGSLLHTNETASIAPIDPKVKQEIDNFISNIYLPRNNYTGLGLAITSGSNNGSLLYSTGYGMMDVAKELPTTNETLFLIGSISKSFAAIVVCKTLHEKFPKLGNAVLDTPIRKLIPEFNFTLNDRYRSEATTFRDMLSHRVCSKPDGISTLLLPFKSDSEIAYRQRYAEEQCSFRTEFVYNNGIFLLASTVIEAIAGRSYQSLLLELLNDLEMHNTTIVRDSDEDFPPNRAIPYYWKDGERHNFNPELLKIVSFGTATGGMVTNAVDMTKYLQFHLNKGKVGDRQVVPEAVMDWLYQTAIHFQMDGNKFEPNKREISIGYALGLVQGISDGWQRIGHEGGITPFTSQFSIYPRKDIGIFTVTNQMPFNETLHHPELHRALFDILRGVDPLLALHSREQNFENVAPGNDTTVLKTLPMEELEKYVGSYGSGLQGEIEITLKPRNETNTTELYMSFGRWGHAYLLATETDNKFLLHWDSDFVQHKYYAELLSENETFGVFENNKTEFYIADSVDPTGKFSKGVSLRSLPSVPWSMESCVPHNNNNNYDH